MSGEKGSLKLKALEPDTFHSSLHTIDKWLYSLEMWFKINEYDYLNVDAKKCALIASALLCDNAM